MKRIGIIGGGQLARMMIYESKKFGFSFTVLDPAEAPPAASCADRHIRGGLYSEAHLRELVESSDVSTYDIEHISTEILKKLEREGGVIEPAPRVLEIIQDKYVQKTTFSEAGLPVSSFYAAEGTADIDTAETSFPFVWKARTGGYDGRGVAVIRNTEDLSLLPNCPSLIEEYVDFEKELAVLVARSVSGELCSYPVVEMIFDPVTNICTEVIAPARIEAAAAGRAGEIAEQAVRSLGGAGVFGVELFLTGDGSVYVNEVAPRPHNSGHYTIEACRTSQFEQHIRAINGLPLGDPGLTHPAVMVNLFGTPGNSGPAAYRGYEEALALPGCSLHIYGKAESRGNRKMGHATCIGCCVSTGENHTPRADIEILRERAKRARELIEITGDGNG
jgi:5-(carboxyamino)imidazole ribonucleotide synthase